jgi:nitroimidazol reductase NimA-like FMN-containing flavoprotein (pyridoxamine 5'-phosphate oxidase superfamily)
MPSMKKPEYDRLIEEGYICRIAFRGERHPYIAPFLYIFDGKFMYFLSTRYGKKLQHFKKHPYVTVEVEQYAPDLSNFSFVSIPGRLEEVEDPEQKSIIRRDFIELIKARNLSSNVLSALGHSPDEPIDAILTAENNIVWKLVNVKVRDIVGLKHSAYP